MKNTIIVVLVLVVGAMGYLLYTHNKTPENNTSVSTGTSTPAEKNNQSNNSAATLNLANKGLTTVPKDILDNGSVTTFDVSYNQLTGALPAEIRKLTNLEVLNASNNKLTGIPAEIGQLHKLKVANFANNDISGLPMEIGNLSSLETLDLRGNPNISKNDLSQIRVKIPNAQILID